MSRWAGLVRFSGPRVAVAAIMSICLACGSPEEPPSRAQAEPTDPAAQPPVTLDQVCRLLKKAEVEEALGEPVNRPADPNIVGVQGAVRVVGMRFCHFGSSKPTGPTVQVGLATALAREVFDKYKSEPPAKSPVPGLGEEAVYYEFGPSASVVAYKDGKVAAVALNFVTGDRREIATALAAKAVARL